MIPSFLTGLLIGAAGLFYYRNIVNKKIAELTALITGKMSGKIDIDQEPGISGEKEIGALGRILDQFTHKISEQSNSIEGHASTLLRSSQTMPSLAGNMLKRCEATKGNTQSLSSESFQVNGYISSVATAVEQANTSIDLVAAASEEMVPEEVVCHRDCAFGKWHFDEGKKFNSLDLYCQIGEFHKAVHDQARAVIKSKNAGAKAQLAKFITAKDAMFEAIDRLYRL